MSRQYAGYNSTLVDLCVARLPKEGATLTPEWLS